VKTLAELRQAWQDSVTAMERALHDVQMPPSGADTSALDRTFEGAKAAMETAKRAYERQRDVEEARAAIPVEAAPADPKGGVGTGVDLGERGLGGVGVSEKLVYRQGRGAPSIFSDMHRAAKGQPDAIERLNQHRAQTALQYERVMAERSRMDPEQRAAPLTQTAGEGGELIAPQYLQDKWIGLPRPGRPIANTLNSQEWIDTNAINLPKVKTGTTVAVTTDTASVAGGAAQTELVTGQAQIVAGQQDVAQSVVDLSQPGVDVVLFDDLTRNYDQQLDVKVIEGAVTNAKGLANVAGVNGITWTQASPKFSEFYKKIAKAIAEVNEGVFMPPTVIAMTPLRWGWVLSQVDTAERPIVVPVGQPGFNAGAMQDKVAAENIVGSIQGIPVIIDANIPKTKGAGTNQDEVYVYRADQLYLWESSPTLRIFPEVLSAKLEVRFQLYGYYTPMFGRLPKAISIISGTGLVAPTF
jgi:HK97 family phage major capsid protein